jgi:hypothetical protein
LAGFRPGALLRDSRTRAAKPATDATVNGNVPRRDVRVIDVSDGSRSSDRATWAERTTPAISASRSMPVYIDDKLVPNRPERSLTSLERSP